jgi:hypothetical protein
VYVPFLLSAGCGAVTVFAPVTFTARFAACPVTGLLFPSRTVIVTVVGLPAVPVPGTLAVVFAGLAAPALTVLGYGLPLIGVPPSVIATLSVPATVGT